MTPSYALSLSVTWVLPYLTRLARLPCVLVVPFLVCLSVRGGGHQSEADGV